MVNNTHVRFSHEEVEKLAKVVRNRPELQLEGFSGVIHLALEEWLDEQLGNKRKMLKTSTASSKLRNGAVVSFEYDISENIPCLET